mgnify:CR=1 FL=1
MNRVYHIFIVLTLLLMSGCQSADTKTEKESVGVEPIDRKSVV